jgi:outer membrane receptor protein involved in Fe transport
VQDIPYNITAITGADLKNYGATDLSKMAQFIPGMQMIDSGARSTNLVTLRGLNVGALEASENQGGKDIISRYVGDTPMLIDLKLIDVERVEVLRGPQGTLYGRGAMGGTLRYILNKPDTEALTADLNSRLYGYEEGDGLSYDVNGTLNLPLTDTLALRVSAGYLDDDGFVDYPLVLAEPGISNAVNPAKDVNTEKTESLRASLRWEPSDTLYVQGNYFLQDTKAGGRQAVNPPFTGDDWDSSLRY